MSDLKSAAHLNLYQYHWLIFYNNEQKKTHIIMNGAINEALWTMSEDWKIANLKTLLNEKEHWQQKESYFRKNYDYIKSISIDWFYNFTAYLKP